MKSGESVPELRVVPGRLLPHRYAGATGDFNPIHVDPESARARGQPHNILHGLYMLTVLARAMAEVGDGDPRRLRRISARFEAPGFADRELRVEGRVSEIDDGRATVEAKLVQDGTDVVTAEAEVAAAP